MALRGTNPGSLTDKERRDGVVACCVGAAGRSVGRRATSVLRRLLPVLLLFPERTARRRAVGGVRMKGGDIILVGDGELIPVGVGEVTRSMG